MPAKKTSVLRLAAVMVGAVTEWCGFDETDGGELVDQVRIVGRCELMVPEGIAGNDPQIARNAFVVFYVAPSAWTSGNTGDRGGVLKTRSPASGAAKSMTAVSAGISLAGEEANSALHLLKHLG